MLTKEFVKYFENNNRKPVLCIANSEIFEELGLEPGSKFYVIDSCVDDVYEMGGKREVVYKFILDFSEFEEENKLLMPKNWYGRTDTDELAYWYETPYYPKDCKVDLYSDEDYDCGFDLVAESKLYKEYKESGFDGGYIQYLEHLVMELSDD